MPRLRWLLAALIACCCTVLPAADEAAVRAAIAGLAAADADVRKAAIAALGDSRDPRAVGVLEDFNQGSLFHWQERLVAVPAFVSDDAGAKTGIPLDPLTRAVLGAAHPADAFAEVAISRRERTLVRDALTVLRLTDPDRDRRLAAAVRIGDGGESKHAALLAGLADQEGDRGVRRALAESLALLRAADAAPEARAERLTAIAALGESGAARALPRLRAIAESAKDDADLLAATQAAIARVESWQSTVRGIGHAFSGISLGSILVVMALGLAIVFGLMGVINMAHGELVMIGAYATFCTQKAVEWLIAAGWLPEGFFAFYFLLAFPVAFCAAGAVGWVIEALLIRHLYGRPLETLLATFGVSLVLIQLIRVVFGDNRAVSAPTWLQGGVEVAGGLVLPWSRLFIIAYAVFAVVALVLLVGRTRIGLLLRATTQNRPMAAVLGVGTRRLDGLAFALGSGIAGTAGCALTLISNITPNMGQELVVDSFLTVVVGGVGNLAGVVIAGLGLGGLTKLFEPFTQAVWAKVLVLLCVIAFIQWKPSGLFPAKGRTADA